MEVGYQELKNRFKKELKNIHKVKSDLIYLRQFKIKNNNAKMKQRSSNTSNYISKNNKVNKNLHQNKNKKYKLILEMKLKKFGVKNKVML